MEAFHSFFISSCALPLPVGRGTLHCSKMEQWNILEQTAIHFQPRKMELIGFKGEEEVQTTFYRGVTKVDSAGGIILATREFENIPPLHSRCLKVILAIAYEDGIESSVRPIFV